MLTPKERLLNDACKILACRGMQGNEPLQLLYPLCKRRPTAECVEPLRNIGYLLPQLVRLVVQPNGQARHRGVLGERRG